MSETPAEEAGGGGPGGKALLLVGLLIGGALGGGAMFVTNSTTPPPTEEELAAEAAKKVELPKEVFPITFDRLTVGLYTTTSSGRRRYLGNYFVKVQVEVGTEDHKIMVERLKNRVQHGFLQTIAAGGYSRPDNEEELDLGKLGKLLKAKAASILGKDVVLNVAVQEALRVSA